jgi:flagellar protein FliS
MAPATYQAYTHSAIQSTDRKERILLMLYEGAVKFARFAKRGIEKKNPKIRGENISKIMALLTELDCALDREPGGILAENLSGLYHYMMERLTIANIKNDTAALDEVERLLLELKEAFGEAAQQESMKPSIQPAAETPEMQKGLRLAI